MGEAEGHEGYQVSLAPGGRRASPQRLSEEVEGVGEIKVLTGAEHTVAAPVDPAELLACKGARAERERQWGEGCRVGREPTDSMSDCLPCSVVSRMIQH